jgi:hypothetical protein
VHVFFIDSITGVHVAYLLGLISTYRNAKEPEWNTINVASKELDAASVKESSKFNPYSLLLKNFILGPDTISKLLNSQNNVKIYILLDFEPPKLPNFHRYQ